MRRPFLIALLMLGVVGGYGSSIARAAHCHRSGPRADPFTTLEAESQALALAMAQAQVKALTQALAQAQVQQLQLTPQPAAPPPAKP